MQRASQKELNYVRQLLLDEEIDLAIQELRNLRKKYPNDSVILQNLGSVLLKQGTNVSEALYLFSLAKTRQNKHSISFEIGSYHLGKGEFETAEEKFMSMLEGNDSDKCYGYLGLIRTYIHTEDYETALDYFKKLDKIHNFLEFSIPHYYNLKFYLLFKNGVIIDETRADNYFTNQLVDYSREAAIEHIKAHLKNAGSEGLETKRFHSVFIQETDIEALYDYCCEAIKNQEQSGYGIVDYYRCELPNTIGSTYSHKETTNVEVVTFPNTKLILSIYPINKDHVNKIVNQKEEERLGVLKEKRKKKKKKVYKKNHK